MATAGGAVINSAFANDCRIILADLLESHDVPIIVNGTNGWASGASNESWAVNAWRISSLGETSDIYCHYIYLEGYTKGVYSGDSTDRVPMFRYNIVTGELNSLLWPFDP